MYERNERGDDDRATGGPSAARSGLSPALVAFIVVAIVALVFVLQNGERAPIKFLFFDASTSVWVAIAIAIGIGILLDRLLLAWWRRRRRAD